MVSKNKLALKKSQDKTIVDEVATTYPVSFSFPPQKQNMYFSANIEGSSEKQIEIINVDLLNNKSVYFDKVAQTLKGVFLEAGDFIFTVSYKVKNLSDIKASIESLNQDPDLTSIEEQSLFSPTYENLNKRHLWKKSEKISSADQDTQLNYSNQALNEDTIYTDTLKISVHTDIKSNWNYLPSSPADIYYKPDFDIKLFENQKNESVTKHLLGARMRGTANAHTGKSTQDDFFVNHVGSGWHILLMANGDIHSKASAKGSSLLARSIGCYLSDMLNSRVFNHSLETTLKLYINRIEQTADGSLNKLAYWSSIALQSLSIDANDETFQNIILDFQSVHEMLEELIYDALKIGLDSLDEYIDSAEAKLNGIEIDDLKSSLSFSVSKKIVDKWFILSYSLKDDFIGLIDKENFTLLSNKFDEDISVGHYVSSAALTPSLINRQMSFVFIDDIELLLLLNSGAQKYIFDGVLASNATLDQKDALNSFKKQVLETKEKEINAIKYLKKWSKGNHADRTFLALF